MNRKGFVCLLWMILIVNVLVIHQAEAATLHAILVADSIGGEYEFLSSLDYMKREVKRIAAFTDLKLNALCFEGYQVRIENVLNHVSKLNIKSDDIVILYFALHGSRTYQKENQWPDLNFSIDQALSNESGYLDFNEINEIVKSKNPRFILSLADCCNAYRDNNFDVDDSEETEELSQKVKKENSKNIFPIPDPSYEKIVLNKNEIQVLKELEEKEKIKAYRHLFLNQKGSVIISSSIPGEISIKYPIRGVVYTTQFLETLHDTPWIWKSLLQRKIKELSWQFILEQASMKTQEELSLRNDKETPQYEIHLN